MNKKWIGLVLVGVGISLLLATFLSPFASASPDGLDRVAREHGFISHTATHNAPLKDYAMPGIRDERAAAGVAGLVGALGAFAVAFGLANLLRKKRTSDRA
jgi:hypothetical protein